MQPGRLTSAISARTQRTPTCWTCSPSGWLRYPPRPPARDPPARRRQPLRSPRTDGPCHRGPTERSWTGGPAHHLRPPLVQGSDRRRPQRRAAGGRQSGFSAERDGYQALLAAVAAGEVAAIVVYDLSRLARNARLMLNLLHELERRQVPLLVSNLPGAKFDGATGRYLFGQLCLAAQLQRDLDS